MFREWGNIMILVFVLLCGLHLPADQCTGENAIDVIRFPDAQNELTCLRDSMTTIASLAIDAGPNEYWKFVCIRPDTAEAEVLASRAETSRRETD